MFRTGQDRSKETKFCEVSKKYYFLKKLDWNLFMQFLIHFIHFRLHTYIFQYMSIGYVFSIIDKISRFYFHLGIFV